MKKLFVLMLVVAAFVAGRFSLSFEEKNVGLISIYNNHVENPYSFEGKTEFNNIPNEYIAKAIAHEYSFSGCFNVVDKSTTSNCVLENAELICSVQLRHENDENRIRLSNISVKNHAAVEDLLDIQFSGDYVTVY